MTIHERLQNWAWTVQWGPPPGPRPDNHARSIEHQYMPELGDVYQDKQPRILPDFHDGEKVEQAVSRLPSSLRRVLKARYIQWPYLLPSVVAQRARIDKHRFEADLVLAKQKLKEALDG